MKGTDLSNGRITVELRQLPDDTTTVDRRTIWSLIVGLFAPGLPAEPMARESWVVRIRDTENREVEAFTVQSWKEARRRQERILDLSSGMSDEELTEHNGRKTWHTLNEHSAE